MRTIKWKAFLVLGLIHVGLFVSLYSLWKAQRFEIPHGELFWAYAGVGAMYAGMLAGALFVYWPLRPWVRRARTLLNWRTWLIEELPTLLALIPVLVGIGHILRAAWEELKVYQKKDSLTLEAISRILGRVAGEAEATWNGEAKVVSLASKRAKTPKKRGRTSRKKAA